MSASTVARPTENEAIGRVEPPKRMNLQQLEFDREIAKARLNRLGEHFLGGLIARARNPRAGE